MPSYDASAKELGQAIAREGWRLVYGAGNVGLMGTVARTAQAGGADVFGVIPVHLLDREVGKTDLSHLVITETMHERKKVMLMNSDAVVLLPGGAGSLEEFFEALTWAQLELHQKPIIILNIDGYWDPLVALIDRVIDQGFADASLRDLASVAQTVPEAAGMLRSAFA
jgi:uncharacterized protein (TIGR00730 family)